MATQTVINETRLPEFQEDFLADIFAQAEALQDVPLPYAPTQVAGLSPQQMQALQQAQAGLGSYAPFLQQAGAAVTQGIAGAQDATTTPTSYQEYMDPFLEDVVQQQYADIARQGEMQQNQLGAQAVGAGAFGGSRQAIAQGEIGRNVLEQQARTGSQLRSAGFSQAQQLANQAAQQKMQQAQLQGALGQTALGLGAQAQQMGVQDINTLLGIGGLTQQFGYEDPTGVNNFTGQAALTAAQQDALAQQALPFQQVGFMSDIFQGVPALQQTYSQTQTPPPNMGSQLLGLGIAGLGAYGAFN